MDSAKEEFFDPEHYTTVFQMISKLQLFLVTLCFARKKRTNNENFMTMQVLEQVEKLPNQKIKAFQSVFRNLDGKPATRNSMEKLSQILNKIPRCLCETYITLLDHRSEPHFFINIFCSELMELFDEIHYHSLPSDFAGFVASLLLDIRELFDAAGYYRAEEFLFVVRNKFLSDLEGVYLFSTFYLEYGHTQLVDLNKGDLFSPNLPSILNSLVEKLDAPDSHPRDKFEKFMLHSTTINSLPNFDCF